MKDICCLHCKRAINIYLKILILRQQIFCFDPTHIIEHFLCTSNGKCRNDQITSLCKCRIDYFSKFNCIIRWCIMIPIAISRFHNDIIRIMNVFRIFDQWPVSVSNIAGKDQFSTLSFFRYPHLNGGRSKQMSGINKANGKSLTDLNLLIIGTFHEMLQNSLRIFHVIHWCHFRLACTACLTISPLCLKFLNVSRIFQHNIAEFTSCFRCKNCSSKPMIV